MEIEEEEGGGGRRPPAPQPAGLLHPWLHKPISCPLQGLVLPPPLSFLVNLSTLMGLPAMTKKGHVKCSMEVKSSKQESGTGMVTPASLAATTISATATAMWIPTALALVDDRLSTEGTGLPFGLSNNLLGWSLFGVCGIIWSLYFVYISMLEEDEESGLYLSVCFFAFFVNL
ncbi:hypothetical protein Dimus_032369 [Dionaea muscipula]